jgi:cytidine deaminase
LSCCHTTRLSLRECSRRRLRRRPGITGDRGRTEPLPDSNHFLSPYRPDGQSRSPSGLASNGRPNVKEQDTLLAAAGAARENSHAPHSRFRVGAAVRGASGRIFGGCNIESASYGLGVCAERVAVLKAISEGERVIEAVAVVTDAKSPTPPCGACRQVLWEFCGDVELVLATVKGQVELYRLSALFPRPFDSSRR